MEGMAVAQLYYNCIHEMHFRAQDVIQEPLNSCLNGYAGTSCPSVLEMHSECTHFAPVALVGFHESEKANKCAERKDIICLHSSTHTFSQWFSMVFSQVNEVLVRRPSQFSYLRVREWAYTTKQPGSETTRNDKITTLIFLVCSVSSKPIVNVM